MGQHALDAPHRLVEPVIHRHHHRHRRRQARSPARRPGPTNPSAGRCEGDWRRDRRWPRGLAGPRAPAGADAVVEQAPERPRPGRLAVDLPRPPGPDQPDPRTPAGPGLPMIVRHAGEPGLEHAPEIAATLGPAGRRRPDLRASTWPAPLESARRSRTTIACPAERARRERRCRRRRSRRARRLRAGARPARRGRPRRRPGPDRRGRCASPRPVAQGRCVRRRPARGRPPARRSVEIGNDLAPHRTSPHAAPRSARLVVTANPVMHKASRSGRTTSLVRRRR